MNWSTWSEFAAMGGYGLYVWGSFGVVALVIAGEIAAVSARRRALKAQQRRRERSANPPLREHNA